MLDRKILIGGVLVAVAIFIAYLIYPTFLSDETLIRRLLEGTVESFNHRRAGSCVTALADDYRDASTRLDKSQLRAVLTSVFLRKQNFDAEDGLFLYPARIPEEHLTITIQEGSPPTAEVRAKVLFHRLGDPEGAPLWEVDATAELTKASGEWLVARSRFRELKGRPPF
ncbi:MAG: hypothetical protein JXA90_02950 [Planctomycetes bacterium]|nr:hypothetical protein [Planctomycetota bacterium]